MFFLPLFDDNPTRQTPIFSWLIIGLCVIAFMWQQSLHPVYAEQVVFQLGFIPANAFEIAKLPPHMVLVPAWATVFTSMFLHGGWMHIGSNMLYLWIFGDNVEESMGRIKFVIFYLLCGTAAAMAQAMIDPASRIPMIGASGGIAGILGAYLILHPKAAIRTFMLVIVFVRFINLPAWLVLGVWIGGQFVAVPQALANDGGGVAYLAHIGGFIAGMVLVPFFKRRDVPLFGAHDTPPERWNSEPIPFDTIRTEARQRYRRRKSTNVPGSRIVGSSHTQNMPWADTPPRSKPRSGARRGGSVPQSKRDD